MAIGRSSYTIGLLVVVFMGLAMSSEPASAQENEKYKFVFKAHSNKDWVAVRYRPSDGATWRAASGKWVKIGESGAQPDPGSFRVVVIAEKDLADWWAFRYNVESGRTWRMSNGNWIDLLTSSTTP